MPEGRSSFRLVGMLVLLLAAVVLLGMRLGPKLSDPHFLPPKDFVEYWAAGRANLDGQNPYDVQVLEGLQRPLHGDDVPTVMMWNPPWTLTLVMPFGALQPRISQMIWLVLALATILFSVDLLWKLYGGEPSRRWVAWLLGILYMPTVYVLNTGQIGHVMLLGLAGFLYLEKRGYPFLAGLCTVLISVKPHLVYLFWPILLLVGLQSRAGWRILIGSLVGLAITLAIPLAFNGEVIRHYREALIHRPPDHFKSPTIGTFLRMMIPDGSKHFGLQFVPILLGVGWLILFTLKEKLTLGARWVWAERLPLIVLISFVTAPYGAWPYDLVILLPAIIQVATQLPRKHLGLALTLYGAINLLALGLNLADFASEYYVWMAPSLLLLYLILRARMARGE